MALNYKDYLQHPYFLKDEPRDMEYFQNKFECRIEDSREYNQYVRQAPYHRDFYDTGSFKMETEVVPMKAIHLTIDNLKRLVMEQEHMRHLREDAEQGKRLWQQEREDRAVRERNSSVEKAYRNYQMLLELCRK
jgi:hypothetical protein